MPLLVKLQWKMHGQGPKQHQVIISFRFLMQQGFKFPKFRHLRSKQLLLLKYKKFSITGSDMVDTSIA